MCGKEFCYAPCSHCRERDCKDYCNQYESNSCSKLLKPPYVCNGCEDRIGVCRKPHFYYKARLAQLAYEKSLVETRKRINRSPLELYPYKINNPHIGNI